MEIQINTWFMVGQDRIEQFTDESHKLPCKQATALDCWDSEEWSAKYGETAADRESMRLAEFCYYTSDPRTTSVRARLLA